MGQKLRKHTRIVWQFEPGAVISRSFSAAFGENKNETLINQRVEWCGRRDSIKLMNKFIYINQHVTNEI
jgi:hypothetical protein